MMWFLYVVPLLLLLSYTIYNRFFHPLAKIPGPFLASITPLWITYQAFHQRRPRLDRELHKRYGSIVRISPNEVLFSNPEYFKQVYGAGTKFTKGRFYEAPTDNKPGVPTTWDGLDMLAETNTEKLRVQKRFAGRVYSTENAARHEQLVDNNIMRFLERCTKIGGTGKVVDIYCEFEMLNVDTMTEFTFATPFGAVEKGSDGNHMAEMEKMWMWWGWIGFLPWLNKFDKKVAPWALVFAKPSVKMPVFGFCKEKLGEYQATASEGKDYGSCLLDDLMKLSREKPEFRVNWGVHLAMTDLGAGVDTMSWTLASVIVGVATTPAVWQRLKAELDAALTEGRISKNQAISYDEAARLSYLQACMHEAMRLWPNIAISLPRDVPQGGMEIDGYYIPAGHTVGMNSSQLGRNQQIFGPDTELFRPERWLEADKTRRSEMETKNLAFGGPSRRCPGLHVAWLCMSKILATMFVNFEFETLNTLDGAPGPDGHVWRELGTFPTKWHGLEVEVRAR